MARLGWGVERQGDKGDPETSRRSQQPHRAHWDYSPQPPFPWSTVHVALPLSQHKIMRILGGRPHERNTLQSISLEVRMLLQISRQCCFSPLFVRARKATWWKLMQNMTWDIEVGFIKEPRKAFACRANSWKNVKSFLRQRGALYHRLHWASEQHLSICRTIPLRDRQPILQLYTRESKRKLSVEKCSTKDTTSLQLGNLTVLSKR